MRVNDIQGGGSVKGLLATDQAISVSKAVYPGNDRIPQHTEICVNLAKTKL